MKYIFFKPTTKTGTKWGHGHGLGYYSRGEQSWGCAEGGGGCQSEGTAELSG